MLEVKAQEIIHIIGDYENNEMSVEHIVSWVNQFDAGDREFILDELVVIFRKTYYSKTKCYEILTKYFEYLKAHFKYKSVQEFLVNAVFLDLQPDGKSQKELLAILDNVLQEKYQTNLALAGSVAPKHFIYFDDVLATGNKVYFDLSDWFQAISGFDGTKTNFQFIKDNRLQLYVCLICIHSWGFANVEFRLSKLLDERMDRHIKFNSFYKVENNIKALNAKLNLMYPCDEQPNQVKQYLNSLDYATTNEDRAFRKASMPREEILFSSSENRIRLENIFLLKGIEILSQVENLHAKGMRPLGFTIKSHKTLGLGTLFFTYRNIPNNCPIVFWWANNNWNPLFVLKNRG